MKFLTHPFNSVIALGAVALSSFLNSAEARIYDPIGDSMRGIREITECEFKPLKNDAQVWFPYMYVDADQKGVFIPAFSQGVIRMNPALREKAPHAWTESKTYEWGSAWAVIPETNYTSVVKPTKSELDLTRQMLELHLETAENRNVPTNYSIPTEVGGTIGDSSAKLYKRFFSATGAEQLNKSHCDAFVTQSLKNNGWFNGGNAFAARAKYDVEAGGSAESKYYTVSKDLYGISDIYFLESLDASVSLKGEKTFVFGQTSAQGKADSVYGCNICRKRIVQGRGILNPNGRIDFRDFDLSNPNGIRFSR